MSATNIHVLDNCINRTMYGILDISHHDNVLFGLFRLSSIHRMIEHRKERFINGVVDDSKHSTVLKVMVFNILH